MSPITIAIDGYSSCGKSTLAKALARYFEYKYIDSGAMYRAVTYFCLQRGIISNGMLDHERLLASLNEIQIDFQHDIESKQSLTMLNGENIERQIREMEVSDNVSLVSPIKEVREKLVKIQRSFGEHGGIVMDGRDIGTAVFPNAELKLFMTASEEIRVKRRFDELKAKGLNVSMEEVAENIKKRDFKDTTRAVSPLKMALDVVVIDNSEMGEEEQLQKAIDLVNERASQQQQ